MRVEGEGKAVVVPEARMVLEGIQRRLPAKSKTSAAARSVLARGRVGTQAVQALKFVKYVDRTVNTAFVYHIAPSMGSRSTSVAPKR